MGCSPALSLTFGFFEEHRLAPVSPLRDMMRNPRRHHSRQPASPLPP